MTATFEENRAAIEGFRSATGYVDLPEPANKPVFFYEKLGSNELYEQPNERAACQLSPRSDISRDVGLPQDIAYLVTANWEEAFNRYITT